MGKSKVIFYFIPVFLCFLFALAGWLVNIHRFWQYDLGYYDFGIFDHAIWQVAHFQAPIIDHFRVSGKWIFADHFNPSIFLFAPIYWFTDKSEALLIVHNMAMAASGLVLFLIAYKLLKNYLASIAILISYFLYIGFQNASYHEFHDVTVMSFFIVLVYWSIINNRKKLFFVFLVITLGFREISAFFGVGTAFFIYLYKKDWRKIAIMTAIMSLIWSLVAIKIIIPYFLGKSYYYFNMLPQSGNYLKELYSPPYKLRALFITFVSFLFLPIFQLSLLPTLVMNIVSRLLTQQFDIGLHHNAEIAPTLAFSTILVLNTIKKSFGKIILAGTSLLLLFISIYLFRFVLHGPFLLAINPIFYRHTKDFGFLNRMIELVPKNATVVAQNNLASRFLHQNVWILRENYRSFHPDYILLDFRPQQNPNNYLGIRSEDKDNLLTNIKNNGDFKTIYHQGDQYVFKRK